MRTLWESLRSYVGALRYWLAMIVLGVFSTGLGLLEQLSASKALPFSLPKLLTAPPAWLWWVAGWLAILVGAFIPFHRLRVKLERWERKQALADELQDAWSDGLHNVLNADVSTPQKVFAPSGFAKRREAWEARVRAIMERYQCSKQDFSHVFELHKVPIVLQKSPHDTINQAVNEVSLRLERIRDVINAHRIKPGGLDT